MQKRIAVLTEAYPTNARPYANTFVHTRNLGYVQAGIDVVVFSFTATEPYSYEGVKVFPASHFSAEASNNIYCHAPNLRNSFRTLVRLSGKNIVLFFHGHEVLHTVRDYPQKYEWQQSPARDAMTALYDSAKLRLVPKLIQFIARRNSVSAVFVSDWMKDQFVKNCGEGSLRSVTSLIIPNAISSVFIEKRFNRLGVSKKLITIRPLDFSKYAIDLVCGLADRNPGHEFHIFGEGRFFERNAKPQNVVHHRRFVEQSRIPDLLCEFDGAIMPTRYDAQGVSVCEFAAFGIPVITSDIPVIWEMVGGFPNVQLIPNEHFASTSLELPSPCREIHHGVTKFQFQETIRKEIDLAQ